MKKERINESHNSETILERYRSEGRFDFSNLSPEEMGAFFAYYRDNYDALSENERIEMFEQFLLLRACPEEEAEKILSRMSEDEHVTIGAYIGKHLAPGSYPKLFHDCWEYFSEYERGNNQAFYIKRFTYDHPEAAIMVAPFIELENYTVSDPNDPHLKFSYRRPWLYERRNPGFISKGSLIEKYFNSFESAQTLMEVCMQNKEGEGLRSALKFYGKKNPFFLFPYLPQLLEAGVIDETEAKQILTGKEDDYGRYFSSDFYRTPEEKNLWNKLLKKVKEQNPVKEGHEIEHIDLLPENLQVQYYREAEIPAKKRALTHIFGSFHEYETLLTESERSTFLRSLATSNIPLFYAAKELKLSGEEIASLYADAHMVGEDIQFMEDFSDLAILIELGHEKKALSFILESFSEERENIHFIEMFIEHIGAVLPRFSEANQQAITRFITAKTPWAWLRRFDYAAEKNIIPLDDLLSRIRDIREGRFLITEYPHLISYLRMIEKKEGRQPIDTKEIRRVARDVFEKKPYLIFYHEEQFLDLYPPLEQKKFIQKRITEGANVLFLECLLEEFKARKGAKLDVRPYAEDMRRIVRENPSLLMDVLEYGYDNWSAAVTLFPPHERFELLFRSLPNCDISAVIQRSGGAILEDLKKNPGHLENLLTLLLREDVPAAAEFYEDLRSVLAADKKGRGRHADDYQKNYVLPDAIREQLLGAKEKLGTDILNACAETKFLVFEERILRLAEEIPELTLVIERDAAEYVRRYPESLKLLRKDISVGAYDKLVRENIMAMAFMRDKYNSPPYDRKLLENGTARELHELNPAERLENQTILPDDYYRLLLAELAENPFIEFYKNQLEKIARREYERNGPRRHMQYFSPDKEFSLLATRISVLNASPAVREYTEEIMRLEFGKREEIIKLFELILVHGLDKESDAFRVALELLPKNFDEGKNLLLSLLVDYLSGVFETEEIKERKGGIGTVSIETLRALTVYYAGSYRKNRLTKKSFREFIPHVVSDTFSSWRAWGAHKETLDAAEKQTQLVALIDDNLLPRNITLTQYESWVEDREQSLEEMLELNDRDVRAAIQKIFNQAVADRHVKEEEIQFDYGTAKRDYEKLFAPMREWSARLKELRSRDKNSPPLPDEEKEYRELQIKIADYRKEHEAGMREAEARLYLVKLKYITLKELDEKTLYVEGKRIPLQKAFELLEQEFSAKNHDFSQDIQRIRATLYEAIEKMFGESKISKSSLRVTDAFDLETYLKIGDEPVESCQNYNSTSDLNQGLLSYVEDPNVKIIQIYDERGKIIARSILRLLEDESRNPALFLERVYSVNAHSKIAETVIAFAKEKARHMNAVLYSHMLEGADSPDEIRTANLISKNSRSPYVYTDAGGGRIKNGVFTIRNAFRIDVPPHDSNESR
ncbi:MAG: hypothetical protein A2939_01275 [Parcubacteria group bacterium RIFCSPLOWO2_01_FULL_48_18]|nr:MAG: hypothetical protein A2939_01275 [Parcubacteria group bacterium RIFCSPLOWO2_01_FULL_48_18]